MNCGQLNLRPTDWFSPLLLAIAYLSLLLVADGQGHLVLRSAKVKTVEMRRNVGNSSNGIAES